MMRARRARPAAALIEETRQRAAALALGGPVEVRVSARARRLQLRIDAASRGVELVLPRGIGAEAGLGFLAAHRRWIAARLDALPQAVPFAEGAVVPVLGVPHRIRRVDDPAAPPVAVGDGEIRVRGAAEHVARRVRDHLVLVARQELTGRARAVAARLGKSAARVQVRDTQSRWGSCSPRGNLFFSWRLIFAPPAVVDYVVAHEVAHLVEMNHGARFWRLVATLTPEYAGPRAWLRTHRSRLFSYG